MSVLGVKELPGVGRSLERRLAALGVLTCGDMQAHSLATLQVVNFSLIYIFLLIDAVSILLILI